MKIYVFNNFVVIRGFLEPKRHLLFVWDFVFHIFSIFIFTFIILVGNIENADDGIIFGNEFVFVFVCC